MAPGRVAGSVPRDLHLLERFGCEPDGIGHLARGASRAGGGRVYIETSHRADYQATRGFYERCGYQLEAVLTDFYAPGDSKAIYVRAL